MQENLYEVFSSIREHKTRNMLTGFGIAWGIFILVILLGAGSGLQKGVFKLFGSFAQKSIWVFGGATSTDTQRIAGGKAIEFNHHLLEDVKMRFKGDITEISPQISLPQYKVQFDEVFSDYSIVGVNADYFKIKTLALTSGRFINAQDDIKAKKIAVIGDQVAKVLFKKVKSPIGQFIQIGDLFFTVVGVLKKGSIAMQQEQNNVYIPVKTLQEYFNQGTNYNAFLLNLSPKTNSASFELNLKKYLARILRFDYQDTKALMVVNFEEQIESFNKLFNTLKGFLWFIGICLLLTGVVGVGNIMLVIVKERTREIGIRKAVGATPRSIISLILTESVLITLLSGIVGLLLSTLAIYIVNMVLRHIEDNGRDNLINHLGFNLPAAVIALCILMISGCLAGIIPAQKAARIKPIDAIRQE